MALLQISEPGQSPDPHTRRIAVGIDLGTTHSLVAAVKSGVAECLPDEQGAVILPSVVRYLPDNGRQIGALAQAAQSADPKGLFQDHLATTKESSVALTTPVPVHLVYFTAWPSAKGAMTYRRDIYGRDARIFDALVQAGVVLDGIQG